MTAPATATCDAHPAAGMLVLVDGAERRDDDDLLVAGDAEGFAEFYRRHVNSVIGYLMSHARDPEVAADLTAETFAAALLARRRFRPGGPPARAWLFGIAHNKLVDWRRRGYAEDRARRRLALERIELTGEDEAEIAYLGADVSVLDLVADLPDDQRGAVRARIVEGRDYDEIAEDLSVSQAVVRKRVSRGIAALRSRIGGVR